MFDAIKNILAGIAIPAFFIFYIIYGEYDEIRNDFILAVQNNSVITGSIIEAEEFEDEEKYGYRYIYSFTTSKGDTITNIGGGYGDMPLGKEINDVPFEIEIEYNLNDPNVNRVKLSYNIKSLFQWFLQDILMLLLGLSACFYFGGILFIGGIKDYKKFTRNKLR